MSWFQRIAGWSVLTLSFCTTAANSAPPSLPQRNLVIDWRQIDDSETSSQPAARWSTTVSTSGAPSSVSGGVTVSTQQRSSSQAFSQQMRVLNGGRVTVRLNQSIPVMWVEAAQTTANTVGGYGGANTPRTSGAAVVQGLTWL
ncbi:MAG: hypothetical protein ACOVOX_13575, partial [Burkholderiaceae bacterium]